MNKETIINEREVQQTQIETALRVLQGNSLTTESNESLDSVLELFHKDPWESVNKIV